MDPNAQNPAAPVDPMGAPVSTPADPAMPQAPMPEPAAPAVPEPQVPAPEVPVAPAAETPQAPTEQPAA